MTFLTWWFRAVGLINIVLGLLWMPFLNASTILAWLAITLSIVRGILDDIYMIAAGYPVAGMLVFIALHLAIVVTGLLALRAAGRAKVATP